MHPKPLAATFILHKTRKDRLESVTELNAWGQDINDVGILNECPHIKLIALACNSLKSLRQFSQCLQVQQLLLRKNEVADIKELQYLTELRHLRTLTLSENPVASLPDYRAQVLAALPFLTKLDDREVLPSEVEEAHMQFPDILRTFVSSDVDAAEQVPGEVSPMQSPLPAPGAARRGSLASNLPAGGTGRTSAPRRSLQSSSREWGLDHSQLGQEQQQQQQQQEAKSASHRAAPQRQVTPVKFAGSSPLGGASQQPTFGGSAGRGTMKHSPPQQRPQRLSFDGTGNGNGKMPSVSPASPLPPQWQEHSIMQLQPHESRGALPHSSPGPAQRGSKGTADNVFYAIVALLPELSLNHLQWARDEIDARMLELQQEG